MPQLSTLRPRSVFLSAEPGRNVSGWSSPDGREKRVESGGRVSYHTSAVLLTRTTSKMFMNRSFLKARNGESPLIDVFILPAHHGKCHRAPGDIILIIKRGPLCVIFCYLKSLTLEFIDPSYRFRQRCAWKSEQLQPKQDNRLFARTPCASLSLF